MLQAPMHELLATDASELVLEVEGDPMPVVTDLERQSYVIRAENLTEGASRLSRIRVQVADAAIARQAIPPLVIGHEVVFVGLRREKQTLEQVFLALTGPGEGDLQPVQSQ
jgi:hypothetical protein